jgi:hypothetical protein
MTVRERGAAPARKRMPPPVRKILLVLHVVTSVGWLGLSTGYLALGITAWTTDRPVVQHGLFRALAVLGDYLVLPISLLAFTTGILLGLGTQWGLLRHKWVLVKFLLTLLAVLLTPFSFLAGVHSSVDIVDRTPLDQFAVIDFNGLISAGVVSSSMYITCVLLSVFKPWGRTAYGKRKLNER